MIGSFVRQIYLAITDFDSYRRVFDQPLRLTLLFLLFLAASLAFISMVVYAWLYNPAVNEFFVWAEGNLPPLEVVEGELVVQADQPLVLKFRADQDWTFVFDTTGTYEDPQGLEEPLLLFTKKALFLVMEGQTQTYTWNEVGQLKIMPEDLPDYKRIVKLLYFPLAYSFFLIYTLVAKVIQALVLSPLAYSVAIGYGVRFSLRNSFTIALYSLIPAIVIDIGVTLTGVHMSYFELIYLVIAGIYTFMASQKCAVVE